jgi:hypothetical protein
LEKVRIASFVSQPSYEARASHLSESQVTDVLPMYVHWFYAINVGFPEAADL